MTSRSEVATGTHTLTVTKDDKSFNNIYSEMDRYCIYAVITYFG